MVTVRRDIAENYKDNGMSRMNSYDRYLLENESKQVARSVKGANRKRKGSYESYLLEQMSRTEPQRILSEEEYYTGDSVNCIGSVATVENVKRRLSKNGKIFLAVYCLVVLVVAIVLLVTGINSAIPSADASVESADSNAQTVKKMTVEEPSNEETGWFEELCKEIG